jgi:hypothetical protein
VASEIEAVSSFELRCRNFVAVASDNVHRLPEKPGGAPPRVQSPHFDWKGRRGAVQCDLNRESEDETPGARCTAPASAQTRLKARTNFVLDIAALLPKGKRKHDRLSLRALMDC